MCLTPIHHDGQSDRLTPNDYVDGPLSIRKEISGTILITGCLGFLGSVVLESLLRNCAQVDKVYLLVRGKKAQTAQQRVEKMLCGGLFWMLHKQVAAGADSPFQKVVAVEGDLCNPGLGLSQADRQQLLGEVDHVIHCAASIELDADIHYTLRHNYFGTQSLMELASHMEHLCSFVHVSTYFVNNHMPRNSVVKEQLHPVPLELNGQPVGYKAFVDGLMAMSTEEANRTALDLMAKNNFNSSYAFGKHLTELMVVDTPVRPGVQRAIVRPSLIAGLLGDPYPGYVLGYGGPSGYTMGYAAGFFPGAFAVAFGSDYHMDIIPCDVVAAVTIAAAAKSSSAQGSPAADEVPIYHACSAHSHPLPLGDVFECAATFWTDNPPPLCLPGTRYPVFSRPHKASKWGIWLGRCIAWAKILGIGTLLQAIGKTREATLLKNAYTAFSVYNTPRYDRSILSAVDNVIALRAELSPEERSLWPLVTDSSVLDWWPYGYTMFAGVRLLLFRQADEASTEPPHMFKYRAPATGPAALGLCDPLGVDVEVDVVDVVDAGARLRKGMAVRAKGVAKAQVKDQDAGGLCVKAL